VSKILLLTSDAELSNFWFANLKAKGRANAECTGGDLKTATAVTVLAQA